jgi:hypothetical protein
MNMKIYLKHSALLSALFALTILLSCSDSANFDIDQCTGTYTCEIYSEWLFVQGMDDGMPDLPTIMEYDVAVNVAKTGDNSLLLTFGDTSITLHVDDTGALSSDPVQTTMENDNYSVALSGRYEGYISNGSLNLEQMTSGTATYKVDESVVLSIQYFWSCDGNRTKQ